ncbi:hypothetical protein B0H13DRAFT_1853099 [Mycena leptocephala]|nr:hypothetical protein B0H13DRAFT_1853099 [Mycena leptocephala]
MAKKTKSKMENALLADVSQIEATRVAWANANETEVYEALKANIGFLVFALRIREGIPQRFLDRVPDCQGEYSSRSVVSSGGFATNDMDGAQIFESILGPINTQRLQKLFPSIRHLSESLEAIRDTKEAWTTCNSNDLSSFIFETLSQLTTFGFLTVPTIGSQSLPIATEFPQNGLILSDSKIHTLTLDKHRTLCKPGMPDIPRNYRLKNRAAKLHALRLAVAEHLKNLNQGSDMDGDTLAASSRRQSAQMLDVELDELAPEKRRAPSQHLER